MSGIEVQAFYWMSHIGSGSQDLFRRSVGPLLEDWPAKRRIAFARTFQVRALRLGHLTHTSSRGWRMRSPSLTLSPQGGAFWRGGRSPDLERHLESTAEAHDCCMAFDFQKWTPPYVFIYGAREKIGQVCTKLGVRLEDNAALVSAASVPDLRQAFQTWKEQPLPTGAELQAFDYQTNSWQPYVPQPSCNVSLALLHVDRFRQSRYFVVADRKFYSAPNEAETIYAAANGTKLCFYNELSGQFKTLQRLSIRFALPLCLCTGQMPQRGADQMDTYENVPPSVAQLILQRLGQLRPHKTIHWL